jgi:hypothetical protein
MVGVSRTTDVARLQEEWEGETGEVGYPGGATPWS